MAIQMPQQQHGRGSKVWVKQGLDSHRSAQVLLVPLGNIPRDAYRKYCDILRRFSTIPMQNLTAPGDWNRQNSALKHFNWSEGCFSFHFIDVDTTDGGPSEWEDYQAYRRVVGAIGVVHFPSCEGVVDFKELERQFVAVMSSYKHVHAKRIFAFGHSFEQGAYPDILDPQRDIVFPPEQEFPDGGSTTELHMAVSLYDVAVSLIKTLAADVKTWDATSQLNPSAAGRAVAVFRGSSADMPPLTSRYDREEGVSESKLAKRRPGRLHKWIGDTCLLAGSPKDALEHYSQSMSETKASSDPLWYVGCLEGYAACLVAMSDADHPMVHGDQALALLRDMAKDKDLEKAGQATSSTWTVLAEAVVTEKCAEALSVLSRYPALGALEVELCFKTARFHACAQPEPRWDEALEMLLRALSVPDMPMQVQLERSIEAAILCEGMGLKRKAALFAHLSAMLCSDFEIWQTAHLLARMAAEGYGVTSADLPLPSPSSPSSALPPPFGEAGRGRRERDGQGEEETTTVAAGPAGGWVVLRKHLLQWLLAVSARCGDARASSAYFAGLTGLVATLERERRKADRFLATLPAPQLDGVTQAGDLSSPVSTAVEVSGNSTNGPPPSMGSASSKEQIKISWSERMIRRATASTSTGDVPPPLLPPPTPSGGGAAAGAASSAGSSAMTLANDSFLSVGHGRIPVPPPASPGQSRRDDFMLAAHSASFKKSRKTFMPKSIGRKMMSPSKVPQRSITRDTMFSSSSPRQTDGGNVFSTASPAVAGGGGGGGGSGSGASSTAAVAHRAALTREEQWETLVEMAQCTARLSPEDAARVQLPGIPRLESARLLHFDGALALLPGDGSAASSSSSRSTTAAVAPSSTFFYNPFDTAATAAAGGKGPEDDYDDDADDVGDYAVNDFGATAPSARAGGSSRAGRGVGRRQGSAGGGLGAEVPARWVAGETGRVVARLSNPLRVPLEVESIVAVVEGARVQAFPTRVLLPPKVEFHEVILFVKPLEDGELVLTGLSVEVLSLVTLCNVDKWGRGLPQRSNVLLPPRSYKSLAASFRRPAARDNKSLTLTVETVDIQAAAAKAAAEAEMASPGNSGKGHKAEGGQQENEEGETVVPPAPKLEGGSGTGSRGAATRTSSFTLGGGSGAPAEAKQGGEEGEEFVPDPYMRRDETACRKVKVEEAAPLLRMSRSSPPTSEALAGEEVQEVIQLENGSTGPSVGMMEVWTRPCPSKTQQQQQRSSLLPSMTLLYSLSTSSAVAPTATATATSGTPAEGAIGSGRGEGARRGIAALDVLLDQGGATVFGEEAEGHGGVLTSGAGVRLALLLRAGMAEIGAAGGRGRAGARGAVAATEVLVKYSKSAGAAYHRQLRVPVRLSVRGGLRVCSLRVGQFLGGGLCLDRDTDSTACVLLVEIANHSTFPIFVWRPGSAAGERQGLATEVEQRAGVGGEGEGATEIPGGSRQCLSLEIPRLQVGPEEKGADADEPRSPLAVRPLFEWEKSLSHHLYSQLELRWATDAHEATVSAATGVQVSKDEEVATTGSKENPSEAAGGMFASGRRGTLAVALEQVRDDGCCQNVMLGAGADQQQQLAQHLNQPPLGVPACLMGALLPPVRLTCLPFCFVPSRGVVARGCAASDAEGGVGDEFSAYPKLSITPAGEVKVDSKVADDGLEGIEGAWAAKTRVDSFLPVALLVHNPTPWPVEVEVQASSEVEGCGSAHSSGEDEAEGDADAAAGRDSYGRVMWSGMPSRKLGKISPGSSACHGLVACFLTPGASSVGFTCRVKVESPSAPYGSATAKSGAAGLGGSRAGRPRGMDDDDSNWHPVLCHRPLSVSVFSHEEADAIKLQTQVFRKGGRMEASVARARDGRAGSKSVMSAESGHTPAKNVMGFFGY